MGFDFKRATKVEVNVGADERKIRYGVGVTSLLLSVFLGNIVLLLAGMILVATAKTRFCPVYGGLGKTSVKPGEPTEAVDPAAPSLH